MVNRVIIIVLAALAAAVSLGSACSVIGPGLDILGKKNQAEATVHGILVKKGVATVCQAEIRQLHFRVTKAYGFAAAPGDTVVIGTPINSAACGVDYDIGTEVVVFAAKTPYYCQPPVDQLFTSLADFNVGQPTQEQLDSLHVTLALRDPADGRVVVRKSLSGGFAAGLMTFPMAGASEKGRCAADGRVLAP